MSAPRARIERVVVNAGRGDARHGQQLAARFPAALERVLRDAGGDAATDARVDARMLRALVERAAREAAR
ncbi:MAG: hypothetical protein ACRDL8_19645 [Solirubrobacteraceae bacterium]